MNISMVLSSSNGFDDIASILGQFNAETGIGYDLNAYDEQTSGGYVEWIEVSAASGELPDVFYVPGERVDKWADMGILLPVDGMIDEEGDYYSASLDAARVNGSLYCVPRDLAPLALLYNRDKFDAVGLSYPSYGMSWNDLIDYSMVLYEFSGEPNGMGLDTTIFYWLPFIYQVGGSLFNWDTGQMTLDYSSVYQAMELGVNLKQSSRTLIELNDDGWVGGAFINGNVGMVMQGSWMLALTPDMNPQLNW
ncbi:MAG TPA: extracellular solute-binding protein, partial [Aggregatilineales bacterium]|nr:extracellular solute-binding protein [Aggregatilineales bacterium]